MKKINFLSMGALALTLASCGGGGGDSGGNSVSGQVADGYLVGAKVCFDTKASKTCADEDETAISGNTGDYTLSSKDAPIIAEVTTDTTDLDTGNKVTNAYVLSAPKGKTFISPITTMIQGKIESNPSLDADSAALSLKSEMGMGGSKDALYANYVAKKDEDKLYKTLYLTAQTVARAQGELRVQLQARIEAVGGITGDAKKLLKQEVNVGMIALSKDLFTTAKTFVDAHADVTINKMVEQANSTHDTIKSGLTQTANTVFKDKATIQAKLGNANRDKSSDTLQTAEDFLKGNDFLFASPKKEGSEEIELWAGDKYYEYDFKRVNDDFKTNWLTLEAAAVVEKIKGLSNTNSLNNRTLKVKSDGSIEFGGGINTFQVHKIGKQLLAGITLTCSEMIDSYYRSCNGIDGTYKGKTVLFGVGDERYHFSFTGYYRFNKSNVVDKLKAIDFNELCPTIDSFNSYCRQENGLYDVYLNPTAGQSFSNDPLRNISYFWVSDASSSNRKVEVCSYDTDSNICKVGSTKMVIGTVIEAELKNGEKVFIAPKLYDNDLVVYNMRLKHTMNGETKEYRVRGGVSSSNEPRVGLYSPFNWSAYKKIIKTFNP